MQSLLITKDGVEKARIPLRKKSFLIGRSPSCDVVLRGQGITAIHFVLEWLGEGDFDSSVGLWSLVSLAQGADEKHEASQGVVGDVLSQDKTKILGFDFVIVEDRLAETDLKKGVLSRQLKNDTQQLTSFALANGSEVLEVISYRNDLDAIIDVQHFSVEKTKFPNLAFASTQINFVWEKNNDSVGFIEDRGSFVDYQLLSHGTDHSPQIKKAGSKLEVKKSDMLRLKVANREYILRFVSPLDVILDKQPIYKDAYVQVMMLLCLCFFALNTWIRYSPAEEKNVELKPERVATVEVKEYQEPPPPPVEKKEEIVAKVDNAKIKPKEDNVVKKNNNSTFTEFNKKAADSVKKEDPSSASAASLKNVAETEKPRAGLNNPAPVKNVNRIGLLGKLKSGGVSNSKVSADMALNQGIVSETVSGQTGFTVQKAPMGELGIGKKDGGGNSPGLAAAATTMKNPGDFNAKSVGPIGATGAGSLNSVGAALKGKEGDSFKSNGNSDNGELLGGSGFDVEGGLTKDDIRKALAEHRRAIRNCYEIGLISKKDLQGRLSLKWQIRPDGTVEFIEKVSSDLKMASLENCVQGVVKGIIFPKSANKKATLVNYPFIFQGKK